MHTRSFRSARGGSGRSFGSRQGFRGGNRGRGGRRGSRDESIDPSKFINKIVLTEEVEHYKPEHNFHDFDIVPILKQAIINKKYSEPTPIQDRAIPHILAGQDVVGIANTGTGKTAAFLIPLINKVRLNPREQILIIVPTRELALQIEDELKGFTRGMKIFSVTCVGGMSIGRQISELRYHNNFVIGTPGRLKDLIERGNINRAKFGTIVLDEADRMLDMGFINDIRFVMSGMPKPRHTLFFSATISTEIENLIHEFLRDPIRITVKTRDTSSNVEQDVIRVRDSNKLDTLHELLVQPEFKKVLVFARTKHGAERLANLLVEQGFRAESIHGNKNQSKRQQALNMFKDSRIQVLVATDVAARGLDIANVSHVINYDVPATYNDYIHRIGRTGRANNHGKALTFIDGGL